MKEWCWVGRKGAYEFDANQEYGSYCMFDVDSVENKKVTISDSGYKIVLILDEYYDKKTRKVVKEKIKE